jgi:hypothetical protein
MGLVGPVSPVRAVRRSDFGTSRSGHVDDWSGGGLGAGVDRESGNA